MAFTPTPLLYTDPSITLRDPQHAARVFTDDQFRLAPKFDFLFHAVFSINPAAVRDTELLQRHGTEINLLVKSISLPKFDVSVETVNQYNRKKVIQTTHKFGDTSVTFHDDNMSIINKLWQNYYSYYYADPNAAGVAGAYNRNATRSSDFIFTKYGLDNGSTVPFFNYVKIYQMARHEWVSYKLWNPVIKSWDGHSLDYSKSSTHNFTMTFSFEAVSFDSGVVSENSPETFAVEHYDNTPSPLQGLQSSTSASPSFVSQNTNQLSAVLAVIGQTNSIQNTEIIAPTGSSGTLTLVPEQKLNGVPGIVFPLTASSTNTTARPINLG
jgi:hypothetical protein